jgi:hypothetical protein
MTIVGYLKIDGRSTPVGSEVAAYDPDGVLCGVSGVDTGNGGAFVLQIYGDDRSTQNVDEGASAGDLLTFEVVIPTGSGEITRKARHFESVGFKEPASFPPPFRDKAHYGMNIVLRLEVGKDESQSNSDRRRQKTHD